MTNIYPTVKTNHNNRPNSSTCLLHDKGYFEISLFLLNVFQDNLLHHIS